MVVPGAVMASRSHWAGGCGGGRGMLLTARARQAQQLLHALHDGGVADGAAGDAEADAVWLHAQHGLITNGLHAGAQDMHSVSMR